MVPGRVPKGSFKIVPLRIPSMVPLKVSKGSCKNSFKDSFYGSFEVLLNSLTLLCSLVEVDYHSSVFNRHCIEPCHVRV